MKKITWFRLIFLSIASALALSFLSLYCLVRISELVVDDYRYGYLLYMAKNIEKATETKPLANLKMAKYLVPPEAPTETLSLMEASTEFGSTDTKRGPDLWIVGRNGEILSASDVTRDMPLAWKHLTIPKKIHGIESSRTGFFSSKTFVMKLETSPESYLISHNPKSLFHGPYLWVQGTHTFITATAAVILALSLSFFYLQRKSTIARKVMARLESGDLKARFEVKRFDEFGNLIIDFNRMADKVESLVEKVRLTESSRSQLLQELGHDVRTPLTSLRTTFETLRDFEDGLTIDERKEIFQMLESDISYFQELLDKLTIVATIDTPRYKKNASAIMLDEILNEEINHRRTCSPLTWEFNNTSDSSLVSGDTHLILRLFKNALDNASRFAKNKVSVNLHRLENGIEVTVQDDGPGLSPEAIKSFGKRRERRQIKERDSSSHFSLGLGSVIMKAIADVHNANVEMENRSDESGASLRIFFRLT